MPTRETVEAFVALVESDKTIEAIERFYLPDATTQENLGPPRVGLQEILAAERQAMATVKPHALPAKAVLVDGDRAVIHWVFEITTPAGEILQLDELAYQQWTGEKIASEVFYYDATPLQALMALPTP